VGGGLGLRSLHLSQAETVRSPTFFYLPLLSRVALWCIVSCCVVLC
jgi:hypothetical protein